MAGVDVTVSEYGMLVAQYLCIVNLAASANLELWGGGGGGELGRCSKILLINMVWW